jgi:hypothetical protein
VSFVTNTSWQSYAGETTLSYFSQMAGITVQSFLSAATGMAVAIALVRGFARRSSETIGNAWVDLTRATLYILLPLSVVGALFLASQGVPQTLGGLVNATTLEGATQIAARGPVASQEAIKLMSGDGGGFFNANSAHPFENPTALTNLFEMLLMFLIGAALTITFGRMVGNERQGWSLLGAMAVLFAAGVGVVYPAETSGNLHFATLGIDQSAGPLQAGGNMEGREVRFGIAGSALFANVATDTADGAVNAMHDSFTPLGGGMLMANMPRRSHQQWAAWVFGIALRLYFHRGHQRQRLCRFECKHAVLQPDIGFGDVVRTIPCYCSGARHCWVARRQKESPCFGRHIAYRYHAIRLSDRRHRINSRRSHLLSGSRARFTRGALFRAPALLITSPAPQCSRRCFN